MGWMGKLKKFEYPELIVSVSAQRANKVAAKILDQFEVEDINIEEPDIEDVIRDVFLSSDEKPHETTNS